jgi:4-amino-4-deoxy-L-arabinose transferase-like glycosyltransferase
MRVQLAGIMKRPFASRRLPWVVAVALLLPPVFFLRPVPIDETRYLAVAWNMHLSGQWLVPWLDGAPYSDKAPLLFWLINLVWTATGVHAWAARLLEWLIALATLPLLGSLGRRLGANQAAVEAAQWLWLGCAAMAVYTGIVMFDMLLAACVLAAWRATPALAGQHGWRGSLAMTLALAFGILAKGPVALLLGGTPALLAPWWLPSVRAHRAGFYLRLLGVLLCAVLLALAWAIPAAHAGGPAYAGEIFLRQTTGRLVQSFAHARPWWWYLPILPLMLLPWTLCLGRNTLATPPPPRDPKELNRFVATAFIPGFVIFSLISGKQPHYLLPMLPALALIGGVQLAAGRWRLSAWRAGAVLIVIGLVAALGLGRLAAPASGTGAYVCGALVVLTGLLCMPWRARSLPVAAIALGMLTTLTLCKLAFVLSIGPRYDVGAVAQRIATAQRAGVPLLYVGSEYGLFTFAGRLTAPIPSLPDRTRAAAWARAHPAGWVIGSDDDQPAPPPIYRQLYLGRSLGIWRAADIAAARGARH